MGVILDIFLIGLCLIFLGIACWYSVYAAINTKKSSYYNKDKNLRDAHKYLTYSSIISAIGGALLIILTIVYFSLAGETLITPIGKVALGGLLAGFLIILIITGIFNALALDRLRESANYNKDSHAKKALTDTVLSVSSGLGSVIFTVTVFIVLIYMKEEAIKKGKSE